MSVYIKGMEMPQRCFACPMCDGDCCGISHASYIEYREVNVDTAMNGRPDWCPLIFVPDHGRLIDGDYLKQTHCAECTLYPDKCLEKTADGCDWGSIIHLRMCPTIIPADKEDGHE